MYSKEKNFTGVEEKDPFVVYDGEKLQGITIHKTDRVKYYVPADLYLNIDKNFLKNLTNASYASRDADTEFPNHYPIGMQRNFYERYVYEVSNPNTTVGVKPTKEDFILPTKRTKPSTNTYDHFHFENEKYYWKDSTWSDHLKKLIFTEGRRIVLYRYNTIKIKPDDFISPLKKEIVVLMTPIFFKGLKDIKDNDSMQSSFFLYDCSNIIKKTFVSEVNDFLAIMCSFGYFGNITNTHKINLISAKNARKFYILKHVSGTELVLDYVVIRGQ